MRFFSDNTAGACPEILDAIAAANRGLEKAYGDDPWTRRLDEVLSSFFAPPSGHSPWRPGQRPTR